jgi:hypothetical protein
MVNNNLDHKSFKVPDKVANRITQALKTINVNDKQAKGLKRAKDMVDNKRISYGQMKRLKNYFDSYEGDGMDAEFKLIGGTLTRKWVLDSLSQDRESIHKIKKARMDAGEENQFLKPHTKDKDNANPTKANGGMIKTKDSFTNDRIMSGDAIYQEQYNKKIDSIKYLIEYMNKN